MPARDLVGPCDVHVKRPKRRAHSFVVVGWNGNSRAAIAGSGDLKAMGRDSAAFWHTFVEAKKIAYEDRARFIADPAFAATPVDWLLSKAYARKRAALVASAPSEPDADA